MKRKLLILVLIFTMLPIGLAYAGQPMKGVWISTVYNVDYPEWGTQNPDKLMSDADKILDNCKSLGFNTIFLQVRPEGDALYESDIFPYSKWLTGKQGLAPDDGFDTLEYWVNGAHSRGMELHAWINPYRVTTSDVPLDSLDEKNPARQHPEYTIHYTNGNYYYNPAMPEVRQLVIDGALEIIDKYDVDGIHMDDYFYPGKELDDDADFEKYNTGFTNKEDWRRNNVDMLVRELGEKVRQKGVTFGISPSGIWGDKRNTPNGSDTIGFQSYYDIYADTRKWAQENWIDYIAPQIYWEIGHSSADYATLVKWWSEQLKNSETKLYIGIADYKTENGLFTADTIRQEFDYNKNFANVAGEIHYHYGSIMDNYRLGEIIREHNLTGDYADINEEGTSEGKSYNAGSDAFISYSDEISVYLNGAKIIFDQNPIIENDRTLVPMRAVFEAFGMNVEWNGDAGKVRATDEDHIINMTIGIPYMTVNGKIIELDVSPVIISDRTLVPLRAISESLGADVEWDEVSRSVYIN